MNSTKRVNILEIPGWETPASKYGVAQVGNHRIAKHIYQPGLYTYHGIDGYSLFSVIKPLTATTLMELRADRRNTLRWHEWMVDSPTDYRAMCKYAEKSYGNVLTSGLGLGLITHELCKNRKVESITVVEISPEVIELVKGYLPDDQRVHIIEGDFWKFIDKDNSTWDCIIVDIWVYYGLEQQLEMYQDEIVPASIKLKGRYPNANIVFHGFAGMPSEEALAEVMGNGDKTNPLVIDPLIYGLSQ